MLQPRRNLHLRGVVGYPLKNQGSYNIEQGQEYLRKLDIHLKIKAVTTYKLELDEFQLYIIKIK